MCDLAVQMQVLLLFVYAPCCLSFGSASVSALTTNPGELGSNPDLRSRLLKIVLIDSLSGTITVGVLWRGGARPRKPPQTFGTFHVQLHILY